MNFNNLMIGTEDAPRLVAFYRKLFGEPVYTDDSYTTWKVGTGYVTVGAHSEVKGTNASPGRAAGGATARGRDRRARTRPRRGPGTPS